MSWLSLNDFSEETHLVCSRQIRNSVSNSLECKRIIYEGITANLLCSRQIWQSILSELTCSRLIYYSLLVNLSCTRNIQDLSDSRILAGDNEIETEPELYNELICNI